MDFATARQKMVESQLRTNKVTDEGVLEAMREIPRESFVPMLLRDIAYIDEDIEIAAGRYIMEPMIVGRMMQASQIDENDSILIIGSATGYMAAVAGKLASTVFAVESDADLAEQSESLLTEMAMDNIIVQKGPLKAGCAKQGPFDVILIDGAVDGVPDEVIKQLADGGRLLAVIKQNSLVGVMTLFKNQKDHVSKTPLFDANVKSLNEFDNAAEFAL